MSSRITQNKSPQILQICAFLHKIQINYCYMHIYIQNNYTNAVQNNSTKHAQNDSATNHKPLSKLYRTITYRKHNAEVDYISDQVPITSELLGTVQCCNEDI